MDPNHNPEFTLMEAYLAYSNLEGMMELTENMYKTIAKEVFGKYTFTWYGNEIDLFGNIYSNVRKRGIYSGCS